VIRLVDRDTKRTIHAPRVYTARRAYSDATQWLSRNGLTKVTITDRESGWILFAARGYRPVPKPIGMLRATSSPSDILTIELERGFERPLTFVDSETHAQLAGVAVIAPSGETQLSDSEGKVWLRAREWPPPYRVVLHGYKTIHWDPNASPDWKRVVQLELDPTVPR
jgi:hypothetical protein